MLAEILVMLSPGPSTSQPQNIRTGNKKFVGQILALLANNPGDAIDFGLMFHEDTPYLARL